MNNIPVSASHCKNTPNYISKTLRYLLSDLFLFGKDTEAGLN